MDELVTRLARPSAPPKSTADESCPATCLSHARSRGALLGRLTRREGWHCLRLRVERARARRFPSRRRRARFAQDSHASTSLAGQDGRGRQGEAGSELEIGRVVVAQKQEIVREGDDMGGGTATRGRESERETAARGVQEHARRRVGRAVFLVADDGGLVAASAGEQDRGRVSAGQREERQAGLAGDARLLLLDLAVLGRKDVRAPARESRLSGFSQSQKIEQRDRGTRTASRRSRAARG